MAEHIILENGRIHTLDRSSSTAEAVAICNRKIVQIGPAQQVTKDVSPHTRRIDLMGRTVVPGFFDGHPHMDREGLKARGGESLAERRSVADIVDAVAAAVKKRKPGEWVVMMPLGDPPASYMRD